VASDLPESTGDDSVPSGFGGYDSLAGLLDAVLANYHRWELSFGPFERHPAGNLDGKRVEEVFNELGERLAGNYPFFHPRYAGQMLCPPHSVAVAGYLGAMLVNPNNHALDGGPPTAVMEKEVVADLAEMFGIDNPLGHLTTSGTVANLEALFVARESHPGKGIAFSSEAHYTHGRMAHVLGIEAHPLPVDKLGRLDLEAAERLAASGRVGTLVLTAGTTGLGAIDRIDDALQLKDRFGLRLHVDAAYGGFFTLLAGNELEPGPWRAISACDSVVVDPHKRGLQPYGCGAVLFTDPGVGRFYLHDSPYTYFTSDELHLGEISLECSRAGASAAALWTTLQLFPLNREGLGSVLVPGLQAARNWAAMIEDSAELTLYQRPELDIVTYFPSCGSATEIDEASQAVFSRGMESGEFFLSLLSVTSDALGIRHPQIDNDSERARILRSVLMKPELDAYLATLDEAVLCAVRDWRAER
jgi:glutamate/tyrosine decarboxylase-like PLP-dependent enzyme